MNYEKAREKAMKELRYNIGNLPYIKEKDVKEMEDKYIFPIYFKKTIIPGENEDELKFSEGRKIGEIKVGKNGEVKSTSMQELENNIEEIKQKVKKEEIDII